MLKQSPQQPSQLKETGQTRKAMGKAHEKLSFGEHVVKHKLNKTERFFTRAAQISKTH